MSDFHRTTAWRKLRSYKLGKDPLCQLHLMRGVARAAVEVHHLLRIEDYPEEALNLMYLQSVCAECHDQMGKRQWKKARGGQNL